MFEVSVASGVTLQVFWNAVEGLHGAVGQARGPLVAGIAVLFHYYE